MGDTKIQWTNATWNPWHGCHKVSPGCKFCYMFSDKKRYGQNPNVVVRSKTLFDAPLKWAEGKLIFTCSWSDWFIEEADEWRDEAYGVIRQTDRHTYQILTKRIERAAGRFPDPPLPNVWIGVSVESPTYKYRIDILRETPAALRFLSIEPLLEDIGDLNLAGIGWVIVGGESGHGARPLNIQWVRNIVRQCRDAGVPVFVKQLGAKPFDIVGHGFHYAAPGHSGPVKYFKFEDRKGGDMAEWDEDLRVREFPEVKKDLSQFELT